MTEEKKIGIVRPEAKKHQPYPLARTREQEILTTKVEILEAYKKSLKTDLKNNLTKAEQKELKELRKDEDVIIEVSDKDKQFVVSPKSMYIEKVSEMLADTKTYQKLNKNPLPSLTKDTESVTSKLGLHLPKLGEITQPYYPRLPEFYCSWKTHKNQSPPPMRPVTSQCDGPTERLAALSNYILQQAMKFVPVNIHNSHAIKKKLECLNGKIKGHHILFTADIKSLYTNVPLDHGLKVVCQFVKDHIENIDMVGLEFCEFREILSMVVKSGYFRFDEEFYRQIDGLAMGVKPAPPFAIIYIYCTVELPLLENDFSYVPDAPRKPDGLPEIETWDIYVDDCLSVTVGEEEDIKMLFDYINTINPAIQFTYETSKTSVNFLDLTIHLNSKESKLDFELFIKPTSKGIFLNYDSNHSKSVIINSAKNEFRRAITYGTTETLVDNGVKKVRKMLGENGYPEEVLDKALREVRYAIQNPQVKPDGDDQQRRTYLCLPYVSEANCRQVHYILRKNNLLKNTKVTFTPGQKLKDTLTSTKLKPTKCNAHTGKCYQCEGVDCMRKNFCYQLTCTLCSQTYVGESGRFYRSRMWEHYRSVSCGNRDTAMGGHYLDGHAGVETPDVPFEHKVLRSCKDYPDRLLWQSIYIKHLSPAINTQHSIDRDQNGGWIKNTWQIL